MKKLILSFIIITCSANLLFGQTKHFLTHGTIVYEKVANVHALFQKTMTGNNPSEQRVLDYVKAQPQFRTLNSKLSFSNNKTLFEPIVSDENLSNYYSQTPIIEQNNIILADYNTNIFNEQKKVYDETFLLTDTIRHIKWKLTGETRDVAGYPCKRANGIMLDSIYIVAFYTELIPVSGGPESFNGLPGMILSVALPHENLRWNAVKVTDITVDDKALTVPKKGKVISNKDFNTKLQDRLKGWGAFGAQYLKGFMF